MEQVKRDFFLSVLGNERKLGTVQAVALCPVPFDVDFTADAACNDLTAALIAAGFETKKRSCIFAEGSNLEKLLPGLEQLCAMGSALAFDWPSAGSGEGPGKLDLLLSQYGFRLYEQRDLVDSIYWYTNLGLKPPRIPRRGSFCLAVRR